MTARPRDSHQQSCPEMRRVMGQYLILPLSQLLRNSIEGLDVAGGEHVDKGIAELLRIRQI